MTTLKISKPSDLKMNDDLFAKIAAALLGAALDEDEIVDIARKMSVGGIRTVDVFLKASEARLVAAQVPPGALVAFEDIRTAAAQAAPGAEPDEDFDKMKPQALLEALERGEKRREALEAARKKLKFALAVVDPETGEQKVDAKATWALIRELHDEGEERPAGKTYKGFAVILDLMDLATPRKARWLSPWDGSPLKAGQDEAEIGWRTEDALKGPSAQAFVRFVRTRVRPEFVPAKDAFAMASAMRAAGGDYAKLVAIDPNWRKAVNEYDNARGHATREGRNLQDELLAELVKRGSVPPQGVAEPWGAESGVSARTRAAFEFDHKRKLITRISSSGISVIELVTFMAWLKDQGYQDLTGLSG